MGDLLRHCPRCLKGQRLKDYRVRGSRRCSVAFAFAALGWSPAIVSPPYFMPVEYCPFMFLIPERARLELQRLEATLASEMSCRRAVEILRRFLPASSGYNHASMRNRTLRLGERL